MSLFDYFKKSKSASQAKERLTILIAHDRKTENQPSYLPQLQKELLDVIKKYVKVDNDAVSVNFEQNGNQEMLEINIILPES